MGAGPNWTEEEKKLVAENLHLPVEVLAEKIGRTVIAVTNFKHRLKHGKHDGRRLHLGQEFDERPSGWYVEVIGALLLDYEDAFSSWKHFHRYTDVKVMGVAQRGWVTLLCKRNAIAP